MRRAGGGKETGRWGTADGYVGRLRTLYGAAVGRGSTGVWVRAESGPGWWEGIAWTSTSFDTSGLPPCCRAQPWNPARWWCPAPALSITVQLGSAVRSKRLPAAECAVQSVLLPGLTTLSTTPYTRTRYTVDGMQDSRGKRMRLNRQTTVDALHVEDGHRREGGIEVQDTMYAVAIIRGWEGTLN